MKSLYVPFTTHDLSESLQHEKGTMSLIGHRAGETHLIVVDNGNIVFGPRAIGRRFNEQQSQSHHSPEPWTLTPISSKDLSKEYAQSEEFRVNRSESGVRERERERVS